MPVGSKAIRIAGNSWNGTRPGAGAAGTLLALALVAWQPAESGAAEAQTSVEVPAGEIKTIRLRRLPRDARITVRIATSGRVLVALVSALRLKQSPGNPEAVFRGVIDRLMTFRVAIPESGDYYLALNNRRGAEALKIRVTIHAERAPAAPEAPAPGRREDRRGTGSAT